jgi:lipoprotein-anchoring transpeptidase ErfK/SrfK
MIPSQEESRAPSRISLAAESVHKAQQALKRGKQSEARRWAEQAATIAPELEEPWLLLGAVASPKASLFYLKQALEINPGSERARAGMHWAIKRYRSETGRRSEQNRASAIPAQPVLVESSIKLEDTQPIALSPPRSQAPAYQRITTKPSPPCKQIRRKPKRSPWILALFFIIVVIMEWFVVMSFRSSYSDSDLVSQINVLLLQATHTFTPTLTFTPTPSLTFTSTFTPTSTSTETPTPTSTETPSPTPTETFTLTPSETPPPTSPPPTDTTKPKKKKIQNLTAPGIRPLNVGTNDRWVDVDLSSQTTYAYQGDQMVNQFVVSTGLWPHLTITGLYRIYVKYRYADMQGDDYYLPNVPYVMYFYKGYGLHGTYWHNNFGHPMSHGCINLRIDDAGWLFNWAAVGTVISIHQ